VAGTAAIGDAPVPQRAGLFTLAPVPGLNMPDGYKRSIVAWFARNGGAHPGTSIQ
jgi:hypothetical protein